ncbi:family 43 glycosylhydrolase [Pontiella sp.]|uniref:family 43 glycosylhydrolase n=1 Tax=Pontiella sp. TaxID=2837462 RepID=UPI00356607B9
MKINRMQSLIMSVGLMACAAHAAVNITLVGDGSGYDVVGTGAADHEATAYRSTGVTKTYDIDGDQAYGTAGLLMFGDGGAEVNNQPFTKRTQVGVDWATFSQGSDFTSIAQGYGQGPMDDPTAAIGATVADWGTVGSAVAAGNSGAAGNWNEIVSFTVDASAPQQFRIGLVGGTQGQSDGRWDPTGYRLSEGTTIVTVAGLENNGNGNPNFVFFDVDLNGETSGTFTIEGQQRLNTQGASLVGVTFDVPPGGVFPTAPEIAYFVVAHTKTEGLGKAAWSVSNAVSVTILDASDDPVAGVSGIRGTVDITYISGDTFTLVAESSNGLQRTQSQTITTTTTLEDEVTFTFTDSPLTNYTDPTALTRRDPSDVIKVGDTWHVWYSKAAEGVTSGYDASVWHATSTNSGNSWVEQSEAIPRGSNTDDWDVTSTFTPNILFHDGTYYLYYTAVGPNFTQDYAEEGKTRIGVATASSPYGPWTKYAGNPVLIPSADTTKFDSFRIDDTCMAVRGGDVWMYYKGRPWGLSASNTKMGVAVATNGVGPFVRQNGGDPVQLGGHEVQIWADENEGIYSMVNGVGPAELIYTIQYAADGLNFSKYADISSDEPGAPGMFRWELTDPSLGCRPDWGVYGTRQIGRYEIDFPVPEVTFTFDAVSGVGPETGVYRRDPSDIIKVGDTWHVWYSKPEGAANGPATIGHATSTNAGLDWVEQAVAIPRTPNSWDGGSAFTPNILLHEGIYYLYYTGVNDEYWSTSGYVEDQKFRIGVASSDSPYGPWTKYAGSPILIPSADTNKFDSFRVDDSCLTVKDGKIWLYHKGRQWNNTPSNTKMGVLIADDPLGPFVRQNGGDPVQLGGHEVQIWMDRYEGIYSMISDVGPTELIHTIQYAADGMNFRFYADVSETDPSAPGMYRTELTDPAAGAMPEWGMYGVSSLARFGMDYNDSGALRMQLAPASIQEGNRVGDWIGDLTVSGASSYAFELLPIINTNDFLVGSAALSANTVFDASATNELGLFVRGTSGSSTVDAYFDVEVLEASGMRKWRLDQFGADVLAQAGLEATVWGDGANPDGDAFSNADEYAADTLPQDSNSVLRVETLGIDGATVELSWIGGVLATQYVETCSALTGNTAWTVIATNLPPTAVSNVWSGALISEDDAAMFRVKAVR